MPRGEQTDTRFTAIIHATFTAREEHELRVFAETESLMIEMYREGIG